MLGARHVDVRVPNRAIHGYGLTTTLVADIVAAGAPDLLVTVDSGIACLPGVLAAKQAGCRVLVTDHHLPPDVLPAADAIVNPNLRGDGFPSKMLAGVGVMFYLLLALRACLREAGAYVGRSEPDLSTLLDLVALGTVADLVPLDHNNRVLVAAGLKRIRGGHAWFDGGCGVPASNSPGRGRPQATDGESNQAVRSDGSGVATRRTDGKDGRPGRTDEHHGGADRWARTSQVERRVLGPARYGGVH